MIMGEIIETSIKGDQEQVEETNLQSAGGKPKPRISDTETAEFGAQNL
jgi:hypothetical protein